MTNALSAQDLLARLSKDPVKLGDLKKIAKEIKRDHELAMELWESGEFYPRLLATLILDKNLLTQDVLDYLASGMVNHDNDQRDQLADWLLANQLMKSRKTVALLASWEQHPTAIFRRLFWYHQARLRWTGQKPPDNTTALLASLKKNLADEKPEVQWAMNFTAGQIGVREPEFRDECIALGEKLGLYKGLPVAKGCTPHYLPEFIKIEAAKLSK